ncbi:DNA (cytosine-5-)-methyltransferase [Paracoccus yeei]|uniref:DNA cytosine methyltransferase n=1 Tax=Paracoccus yeei TaxID=147645 RepID=UPI0036F24A4A
MRYLSVCSGIEAATQAWHPLGWSPVAFSEIEPFPSAVLAHHYPDVPNRGDMTKFEEWPDEPVDLLCGGTPCQSFSIAGLRQGLADPRGNLMLTFGAIAGRYRPRWLVWENVPGVLSSNGGRDFGTFLGMLGQLGYGFAYRVLDAQHVRTRRFPFAVPQRRRRVWVVGYLGDWRRAAAVLFDRESLSGHPAPRREEGQVSPTIPARSLGGGGLGTDFDCDGGLVAATLDASIGRLQGCSGQDANHGHSHLVAHTLRGEGFDASEDGTGRQNLVPITLMQRGRDDGPSIEWRQDGTANALLTPNGGRAGMGVGCVAAPVAFDLTQITSATNRSIPQPVSPTMAKASNLHTVMPWAVRRLTPRECERLQGFPDDFTAIPWRRKPADQCPDGPRYKTLGNSWAVNCAEWIGERINAVEAS